MYDLVKKMILKRVSMPFQYISCIKSLAMYPNILVVQSSKCLSVLDIDRDEPRRFVISNNVWNRQRN